MAQLQGGETIEANRYIYGKLTAAVVPAKVYPGAAPLGAQMPYVVYQQMPRPGERDTNALGGVRVLTRLRYLVKVIAATLAEAEPLVLAVDQALHQTEGQQGEYYVGNVQRAEPYELPTIDEDGSQYWQTGGFYDLDISQGIP